MPLVNSSNDLTWCRIFGGRVIGSLHLIWRKSSEIIALWKLLVVPFSVVKVQRRAAMVALDILNSALYPEGTFIVKLYQISTWNCCGWVSNISRGMIIFPSVCPIRGSHRFLTLVCWRSNFTELFAFWIPTNIFNLFTQIVLIILRLRVQGVITPHNKVWAL